jgi:hypothetical protein
MTTLATLYPDAPRDCIEALYQANPELTAGLLTEFPEAVFSWLEEGSSLTLPPWARRENPTDSAESVGQVRAEGWRQGRLV